MGTYNSDPSVYTLAQAVAADANVKAKLWSRMLEVGANTEDDFKKFEGEPDSKKPFWKKRELSADAGDVIVFTTIGEAAGPGVRGEAELTGNTSKPRLGTYSVQVDFWRDAVELTKKQLKFLATGKSLENVLLGMLSRKLGRKRMYDMMMSLIRKANGNVMRPNNRSSRDAIRYTDTLTPAFLVNAKARLQGQGARPVDMSKSPSGSPVMNYLAFVGQDAMTNIRNSSSYQNALNNAASKSNTDNPIFNGKLVDWQGLFLWEHIIVNPDADDVLGSPLQPYGVLDTAIAAGTTAIDILFGDGTHDTKPQYSSFYPGYDWIWVEGQDANTDSNDYYLWIVNQSGANAGKAGFYKYTGSSNNGNKITIKAEAGDSAGAGGRLGSATSGYRSTQVGNVTWDSTTMTDAHPVGSIIIPANAYGTPIGYSFVFGAGAALRAEGSLTAEKIEQKRDYGFVRGMGYEGIWGQGPTKDTKGRTRHYVLLEHAVEYSGVTVPYVTT